MGDSGISTPAKPWLNLFGNIGGIVTTLLALISAILGMLGPYPATTSGLTVLVLSGGLWWMRWSQISAKLPIDKKRVLLPDNVHHPAEPELKGFQLFIDPFLSTSIQNYKKTLTQRRTEGGLLLAVSVVAIVFAGAKWSPIYSELSGMYCPLVQTGDLRVIIATFDRPEQKDEMIFEQALLANMQKEYQGQALICRYKRVISDNEAAYQIGDRYKAAIVIWGLIRNDFYQVNIVDTALNKFGEQIESPPIEGAKFLGVDLGQIPFLVRFVYGDILYMQFKTSSAITQYEEALVYARNQAWADKHPELIAEGHYFLGQLYYLSDPPEYQQALNHYASSLLLIDNDAVYISRSRLYMDTEKYEDVISDTTYLIDKNSPISGSAYYNRGLAYFELEKYQAATDDLSKARELIQVKNDPYVFWYLSLAQLLNENLEAAQLTIQDSLPYLDQRTRDDFISGYEDIKQEYPDKVEKLEALKQILENSKP